MARNYEGKVKFSKEEKERIKRKAKELGMTFAGYVRFTSLNSKIKVEVIN